MGFYRFRRRFLQFFLIDKALNIGHFISKFKEFKLLMVSVVNKEKIGTEG